MYLVLISRSGEDVFLVGYQLFYLYVTFKYMYMVRDRLDGNQPDLCSNPEKARKGWERACKVLGGGGENMSRNMAHYNAQ